jgi:hypothetical protein
MGKTYADIDEPLADWVHRQPMFFVGTAALAPDGHVNVSPKGGGTLRVLGPREVAYLDGAGSGIETVAHVRENARIVIMLCAFDGAPRIVRFHGKGEVVDPRQADFQALVSAFPDPRLPTVRSVIRVQVHRVSDSCGYGVPLMSWLADRRDSENYVARSSDEALRRYLEKNNAESIDGLPGLGPEEIAGLIVRR